MIIVLDVDRGGVYGLMICLSFSGFRLYEVAVLEKLRIIGERGRDLRQVWRQNDSASLYGTVTNGFPNLFYLLGPYSGLGHNSVVLMMEAQVKYMISLITQVKSYNYFLYSDCAALV